MRLRTSALLLALVLRIAECGLRIDWPIESAIRSAIRTPRSAILTDSERRGVLTAASHYLDEPPLTITSFRASRSAGGLHDFSSEGDDWWPDPKNPDGPYVRRDGESNPANFVDHRRVLARLSIQVPALVATWSLTGDKHYAAHARAHLRAWFADPATRMNADLRYAQAIHGVTTGRFPLEIERTKPYGYSLFNLDAMATICQILDGPAKAGRHERLWSFELPDGRGMRRALAFMAPFIADKTRWPHARDVQYFDEWPMRHPALLFGGIALNETRYVERWQTLKADSDVEEVVRNFFIRQPILWLD